MNVLKDHIWHVPVMPLNVDARSRSSVIIQVHKLTNPKTTAGNLVPHVGIGAQPYTGVCALA